MNFKIGFSTGTENGEQDVLDKDWNEQIETALDNARENARKSVVQVYFSQRHLTCAYYNDKFDLHCGDFVYVDGKLEGLRGRVVDVSYTFKIKLSDYKRIIGKADIDVKGELFAVGSHFVAFDKSIIPSTKILTWYKAPNVNDDEDFVSSDGSESFYLSNFKGFNISSEIADRGKEYFLEDRVVYICLDGKKGYAIVEGVKPYEVEFTYNNDEITNLVCSCYCTGACKHQFAAMLQLREILESIFENYTDEYSESNYFAAILKDAFNLFVFSNKTKGSISIN